MKKKVEILSREIIKPSSPTPNNMRILNLSLLDILSSPMYTGALLFYTANPHNHLCSSPEEISLKLKQSLSETLTIFYPLAGRINRTFVECYDEGAVFIEARVDHLLSEFLNCPVPESLETLIPVEAKSGQAVTWPALLIQANFFICGGFVITICTSHKITDATSLAMFIRGWAESSRGLRISLIPSFTASSFFPQIPYEIPSKPMDHKAEVEEMNCVTKRFVFDSSKIKKLIAKASSSLVKNPTRVEAITALFWRCATKASRSSSSTLRPSVMQIPVSLRGKVDSLSKHTIGNMLSMMILKKEEGNIEEIQDLVYELRQAKEIFSLRCKEMSNSSSSSSRVLEVLEEIGKVYGRGNEIDLWMCNSWFKLGMYETEFGWGKPVWVTGRGTSDFKNLMLLIDTKDGQGVEAWITLKEEHMALFECDEELLESASLNPPVII